MTGVFIDTLKQEGQRLNISNITNVAQAELNIAYAYFKNNDPDSALAAADRFIKTNPRSPGVDYAYYLKGLVNYNRGIGFVDRFLPTDTSQRDPSGAREALKNL